jgi:hypothetical protein
MTTPVLGVKLPSNRRAQDEPAPSAVDPLAEPCHWSARNFAMAKLRGKRRADADGKACVRNHGRARDECRSGVPGAVRSGFFQGLGVDLPYAQRHATCGNYGQPTCGNPLDHFEIARRSNKIQEPLASLADAGGGGQVKQAMTGMSRRRGIYIIGSTVGTNWTGFEVMEK